MQEFCDQMTFVKGVPLNWDSYENNGNYMIRTMTDNSRKRNREDDSCEFMPLSKRINNLHINPGFPNVAVPSQEASQINGLIENGISSPSSSSDSDRRPSYDPGLSSAQSRYYYDNKLLFELHLERIQRTGQQFPF